MSEIITAFIPCDRTSKNVQEVVFATIVDARWELEYNLQHDNK